MRGEHYMDIFKQHVKTSARKLKLGHEKVSQVENDHNDTEKNYTLA